MPGSGPVPGQRSRTPLLARLRVGTKLMLLVLLPLGVLLGFTTLTAVADWERREPPAEVPDRDPAVLRHGRIRGPARGRAHRGRAAAPAADCAGQAGLAAAQRRP